VPVVVNLNAKCFENLALFLSSALTRISLARQVNTLITRKKFYIFRVDGAYYERTALYRR